MKKDGTIEEFGFQFLSRLRITELPFRSITFYHHVSFVFWFFCLNFVSLLERLSVVQVERKIDKTIKLHILYRD